MATARLSNPRSQAVLTCVSVRVCAYANVKSVCLCICLYVYVFVYMPLSVWASLSLSRCMDSGAAPRLQSRYVSHAMPWTCGWVGTRKVASTSGSRQS
jgi:NhaP-type Na+/H+ or K+/H+ antiporter